MLRGTLKQPRNYRCSFRCIHITSTPPPKAPSLLYSTLLYTLCLEFQLVIISSVLSERNKSISSIISMTNEERKGGKSDLRKKNKSFRGRRQHVHPSMCHVIDYQRLARVSTSCIYNFPLRYTYVTSVMPTVAGVLCICTYDVYIYVQVHSRK